MTAMELANLVEKKRAYVLEALEWAVKGWSEEDVEQRKEIVGEIIRTKHYLRYMDSLRNLGDLGRKVAIVAICEAIDEPDHAITELYKLMHS